LSKKLANKVAHIMAKAVKVRKKDYYLKFNPQDFRSSNKIIACDANAVGVYIKLMCVLFDEIPRGKLLIKVDELKKFDSILLKQNVEQTNKQIIQRIPEICSTISPFFARFLQFTIDEVERGFRQLLENDVIYLEGNYVCQHRMIKDYEIGIARATAGSKGGKASKAAEKSKNILLEQNNEQIVEQNSEQNPNYNYNYNNSNNKGIDNTEYLGEEQKKINREDGEERVVDHYIGNWELKTDIDDCLKYYLEREEFKKDRKDAEHIFVQRGANTKDETIFIENLKKWGVVFNNANRGKTPKRAMRGNDSWVQHLHNWLKKQDLSKIILESVNKPKIKEKTAKEMLAERGIM